MTASGGTSRASSIPRSCCQRMEDRRLMPEARARHDKNAYVMNNNGARNVALRAGRGVAKWVLPWDGNCFVTELAWAEICDAVLARPYMKYFMVPMARSVANGDLLAPGYRPTEFDEPQVLFRRDAREEFDPRLCLWAHVESRSCCGASACPAYGMTGRATSWDPPKPRLSPEAHEFATSGWVSRLELGQRRWKAMTWPARKGSRRWRAFIGVVALLDRLDEQSMRRRLDPARLMLYRDQGLDQLEVWRIREDRCRRLSRPSRRTPARRSRAALSRCWIRPDARRAATAATIGIPTLIGGQTRTRPMDCPMSCGTASAGRALASTSRAAKNSTAATCSACSKARRSRALAWRATGERPYADTARH